MSILAQKGTDGPFFNHFGTFLGVRPKLAKHEPYLELVAQQSILGAYFGFGSNHDQNECTCSKNLFLIILFLILGHFGSFWSLGVKLGHFGPFWP